MGGTQVASASADAHNAGIVHRDIKPGKPTCTSVAKPEQLGLQGNSRCGGARTETIPESTWRLGNSGWARQGEPGYIRQVVPGFRAVLVRPAPDSFTRQLFSEVDGTRTKILDDALDIAVPN